MIDRNRHSQHVIERLDPSLVAAIIGARQVGKTTLARIDGDSPDGRYPHLDLERQRREEEAGCWRDIIPVMRDILTTWEALEQARARAIFLASYPTQQRTSTEEESDE